MTNNATKLWLEDDEPIVTLATDPAELATLMAKFDMTTEDIAVQQASEFPMYKLHETPGPTFDGKLLYGPMGQVARRLTHNTEASLGAAYLNLLVSFGNMVGRSAYFMIDGTRHHTNEFLACIGDSSTGRKGLTSDIVMRFLILLDALWCEKRNMSGFATNQAVIHAVRDADSYFILNRTTKMQQQINRPGVEDKRITIRENELSNVFKLLADFKEKAAETIRNMWDGKPINNNVAGKDSDGANNSLACKEPHGSIIGFTTASLAKATMPSGADTSGDSNRFIWCLVKRTHLCPQGAPEIDWLADTETVPGTQQSLLSHLMEAVEHGSRPRRVPIAVSARKYWDNVYLRLETGNREGLTGRMLSRDSAHIRRLALILCLIDREDTVRVEHLKAAEAIWEYSKECVQFIFVSYSKEQAEILRLARDKGAAGITLTDVHALFSRNEKAQDIQMWVTGLVQTGHLTKKSEKYYWKKD